MDRNYTVDDYMSTLTALTGFINLIIPALGGKLGPTVEAELTHHLDVAKAACKYVVAELRLTGETGNGG